MLVELVKSSLESFALMCKSILACEIIQSGHKSVNEITLTLGRKHESGI